MDQFYGLPYDHEKYADLHMHTCLSDGSLTPEHLVDLAVESGLSAVAVTDHEVIAPAVKAAEYNYKRGYPLEVIVGSEITTRDGHLNGLFLKSDIPSGKSAEWTVEQIHRQHGLAIAPHPLFIWTRSLKRGVLFRLMGPVEEDCLDGFEIYNANVGIHANEVAKHFFDLHRTRLGAPVGGTDGHFFTIGRGITGYTGNIKDAIKEGVTNVHYMPDREEFNVHTLSKQVMRSMILEPGRRVKRYYIRKRQESRQYDQIL